MNRKARLATVLGARPQFIKASAVSREIGRHNSESAAARQIDERIIHTGQHYDYEMSEVFFEQLALPEPSHHLDVGSGPHGGQTGEMLKRLEDVFIDERPDIVLVYGDTNSTLAGALAAVKLNLSVVHVEAGLRSYRRDMPEEVNRVLTDHVASVLLCPSDTAVSNLAREGITNGVEMVGDVMHDVLLSRMPNTANKLPLLEELGVKPGNYGLATVHRAENTDDPDNLENIISAFSMLGERGLPIVLPLHPRTAGVISGRSMGPNVQVIKPLSYDAMLCLQQNARVILTDSGGIQKEAYWVGTPCVTLRDETEWPETVATGWNTLAGAAAQPIVEAVTHMSETDGPRPPIYGTGDAALRIVNRLEQELHR